MYSAAVKQLSGINTVIFVVFGRSAVSRFLSHKASLAFMDSS